MATQSVQTKSGYVTARVNKNLKYRADKVLQAVGVSTSEAITMLLHQIVLRNGLPFAVSIPNKKTILAMQELHAGKGESSKKETKYFFDALVGKKRK
jgi:DNA-damage-inducible protein J